MPHAVTREATPLDLFTSSFPPKAESLPLYAWMYVLLMEYGVLFMDHALINVDIQVCLRTKF